MKRDRLVKTKSPVPIVPVRGFFMKTVTEIKEKRENQYLHWENIRIFPVIQLSQCGFKAVIVFDEA